MSISAGAFEGLDSLILLDLDSNKIESVDAHVFTPLTKLTILDFRENPMQEGHCPSDTERRTFSTGALSTTFCEKQTTTNDCVLCQAYFDTWAYEIRTATGVCGYGNQSTCSHACQKVSSGLIGLCCVVLMQSTNHGFSKSTL